MNGEHRWGGGGGGNNSINIMSGCYLQFVGGEY